MLNLGGFLPFFILLELDYRANRTCSVLALWKYSGTDMKINLDLMSYFCFAPCEAGSWGDKTSECIYLR